MRGRCGRKQGAQDHQRPPTKRSLIIKAEMEKLARKLLAPLHHIGLRYHDMPPLAYSLFSTNLAPCSPGLPNSLFLGYNHMLSLEPEFEKGLLGFGRLLRSQFLTV